MAPPPSGWRAGTWALIGLAVTLGLLSLLSAVTAASGTLAGLAAALLTLLAALVLLVAYPLWIRSSKRLVRERGGNPLTAMPAWALYGWLLAIVIGYKDVFGFGESRDESFVAYTRVAGVVLLIAGVLIVRSRIEALVRERPR